MINRFLGKFFSAFSFGLRPATSLFTLIFIVLSACSSEVDTYPSLANQGILPLSTTNAYSGANLFLARELERSAILMQFFKAQGAPMALEIMSSNFEPARLLMFYPRNKEVYVADLQLKGKIRQWIVRGPFPVEREDYKTIANLDLSFQGEPVFVVWGRQQRFKFDSKKNAEPQTVLVPVIPPTPKPTPIKVTKVKAPIHTNEHEPSQTQPTSSGISTNLAKGADPLNGPGPFTIDQIALVMVKGYADRTESGDLIHTVTVEGQTLLDTAQWYAGKADVSEAIADHNGLSSDHPLLVGTKVTIPRRLVNNFLSMKSIHKQLQPSKESAVKEETHKEKIEAEAKINSVIDEVDKHKKEPEQVKDMQTEDKHEHSTKSDVNGHNEKHAH